MAMKKLFLISLASTIFAFSHRAQAQVLFTENFDSYADQAALDAVWPPVNVSSNITLTVTNRSTSGANSVYQGAASQSSYHGASFSLAGTNLYYRFNFYDANADNSARSYGRLESRAGTDYSGALSQQLSLGRYNNITSSTKYYGRASSATSAVYANGATNVTSTWFQLAGAANVKVGWHLAEVVGAPDPANPTTKTIMKYYVDGVLGGSVANLNNLTYNWSVLGSGISQAGKEMWYDDVTVEALLQEIAITTQPVGQSVNAGANATFTVEATNLVANVVATNALKYQWQFGGTNISGATTNNYTRVNAQQTTAGNYTVIISDYYGRLSVTSGVATLTVTDVGPSITAQPQSVTTNAGTSVTFTVNSIGTDPRAYQWTLRGTNIPSATKSTYTRANVQQADAANYAVSISNSFTVVTSVDASLSVIDTLPIITVQPATNRTVCAGSNVLFSVTTTGKDPRVYQWQQDGSNISGATASTFTRTSAQTNHSGIYTVTITNSLGSVTSSNSVLLVTNSLPIITTQPTANRTVAAGSNVVFTVTTLGTDPRGYQWQFGGVDIAGATKTTYTRSNAQPGDSGNYSVIITNAFGSVTSSSTNGILTVTNTPILIYTQPKSQTNGAGANITFTVAAYGNDPRFYQWQFNASDISGATGTSLIRTNVQPLVDEGVYRVVISNSLSPSGVTSVDATLVVTNRAPVINTQPKSATNNVGTSVTFSVVAVGTIPLNYQWSFNGSPISAATNTGYTNSNVQAGDAGNYTVDVSNSIGTNTSSTAVLTVIVPVTAAPVVQPPVGAGTTNVIVSWSSVSGGTYRVQYNPNLNTTNWVDIADVVASGAISSITNNPGIADQRYYRVILLP